MRTALDTVAPLKKLATKKKIPWKTNQTMKLKKDCRSTERRWHKTKLETHLNKLKS